MPSSDDQRRDDREPRCATSVENRSGSSATSSGLAGSPIAAVFSSTMHAHQPTVRHQVRRADQHAVARRRETSGREREEDVEEDRVGQRDQRQPGDERPRVRGHDQARQAVAEADRDHQRAEPVLRPPPPCEQPGADERSADHRAEDRDQVTVMPSDAVDREGEQDGARDRSGDGESRERAPQTERRDGQGARRLDLRERGLRRSRTLVRVRRNHRHATGGGACART